MRKSTFHGITLMLGLLFFAQTIQAQITIYTASLSGAAEAPPNVSPGTGSVTVTVNSTLNTMRVQCTFSGLTGNTTASHIHAATTVANTGTAGVATQTPSFVGFPLGVTSGTYDQTFDMTLASSYNATFVTANGGTPAGAFAVLKAALDAEKAYFNIHTSIFGGGEIRGFLKNACFSSGIAYVNSNVASSGDGTTWATAFKTLQEALTFANSCSIITQIWVAQGTYYPDEGGSFADNDRNASFSMKNGVAIYGGFVGNEPTNYDLSLRNFATNETILSGDIDGVPDMVTGSGSSLTITGNAGNAYHVVLNNNNGLTSSAVLDGFTISGGNANFPTPSNDIYGGGMFNNLVSPTLRNVTFLGNSAVFTGGGLYTSNGNLTLTKCQFTNNLADFGGAIQTQGTLPSLTATITMVDCSLTGNRSFTAGGINHGFSNSQGQLLFDCNRCVFSNNYAYNGSNYGSAGAFFNEQVGFDGRFTNCLFDGNQGLGNDPDEGGGALLVYAGAVTVVNSTFINNRAATKGGAIRIYLGLGTVNVKNSIFWNNTATTADNDISTNTGGIFSIQNSLLQVASCPTNITCGTGMLYNQNPLFVNLAGGDLRLQACSPAINAGTSSGAPATDILSNARVGATDMGAYEFQGNPIVINAPTVTQPTCALPAGGIIVVNATGTGTLEYSVDNGTNWQPSATFSGLSAGNYTIKVRTQGSPSCEVIYGSNPVVLNSPFTATATDTWTGCVSTDWATPGNWQDGSVPTATDNVTIPNVTNDPIIGAAALAKSVTVQSSAVLTIAAAGSLTIDGSSTGGFLNQGTTENSGTLTIGATSSVGTFGIRNDGTFNNNTGGQISIDRSTLNAIANYSTFTNVGHIRIGQLVGITGNGVVNQVATAVFNHNGGKILVDRWTTVAVYNDIAGSTFNNAADITIGSAATGGNRGIFNIGTFHHTAGKITIDNTVISGMANGTAATFNNASDLTIGALASVANYGIENSGNFNNNTGGEIKIDNAIKVGLYNESGTFTNVAKITIGATASIGGEGIDNRGTFNNNTGGDIKIDRTGRGLLNHTATFNNAALITIGASASVGQRGLNNFGATAMFNNNTGGEIKIDNATAIGLYNESGTFTNVAKITIGATTGVGGQGINNSSSGIFNNNTGGQLTINRSVGFALENFGTLDNIGTIRIGNVSSIANRGIVHRNGGTLNNKMGGLIQIDRTSAVEAFYTSGLVNNDGTIEIGSNAAVTGNGISVDGSGTFNNKTGSLLTINRSTQRGMENNGTLNNYGTIRVGNISAIGATGIGHRGGTFNNKPGGAIYVDQTGGFAVYMSGGIFNNEAIMRIGSNTAVNLDGIIVQGGTFNNAIGGDISINRASGTGIYNSATFNNSAVLTIGNIAFSTRDGIYNTGIFTNTATGEIRADRLNGNGIWNVAGNFQNNGKIKIGSIASTGTGILNNVPFTNRAGAEIHIDRVPNGIVSTNLFTNAGLIRMGENAPLTGSGIVNTGATAFLNNIAGEISIKQTAVNGVQNDVGSTFNNNGCAKLTMFDNLNNAGTFTNGGLFTVNTAQSHTNSALTNNGIIEYPQGNPIPNVTNNDVIVAPIFVCGTPLTPALQIGGMNSFTIGTTWYKEPALTNAAGIYSPNTFTVTNLTAGNTYPLFFEIIDPANMCTRTVSISAAVNAPPIVSTPQINLCTGQTMTLSPTSGGTWQTSNLSMASVTNEGLVTALVPGVVYFTFTSDATKCSANTANVTIKPTPTSNLTASKYDVCPNEHVTLNPNCSIPTSTVNWNPGAPTVTPAAATLPYIYKARCEADGCVGNESSVEVRTHRILVDMKDLDVGALPLPIVRAVKDNMAPANQINAPVFPRRWTFIANGCDASESAEFKLSGPVVFNTIDNTSTYAMFANEGNSFYSIDHPNYGNGGSFPDGTYTLTINLRSKDGVGGPYPKNRVATGALLATRTLQFTVGGQQAIVGGRQSAVVGPSYGSEQWAVVAPNPVFNTMRLKINEAKGQNVGVNLIDASGRIMLQRSFVPETNQHQEEFEVSQLSAGMYFLKVNTENKNATLKVVKIE